MTKPATLCTIGMILLFIGIGMVCIAVYALWYDWLPAYMAQPTSEYYDETIDDDAMMQVR